MAQSQVIYYNTTILVNCTLTTRVSYISRNWKILQTLWKVIISVWTYFHYFDIKSPARGDFVVDLGTMEREQVIFDLANPHIKSSIFTVKGRK